MKHAVLRSIQAVAILAGCGLLGWYIYQMTSGMAEEPDAAEAEAEKKPRLLSVEFTTLQTRDMHDRVELTGTILPAREITLAAQVAVAKRFDWDVGTFGHVDLRPPWYVTGVNRNADAMTSTPAVFQCPSDRETDFQYDVAALLRLSGSVPVLSARRSNYVANWGNTNWQQDADLNGDGIPESNVAFLESPFSRGRSISFRHVTDGLDNTVFLAEVVKGTDVDARGGRCFVATGREPFICLDFRQTAQETCMAYFPKRDRGVATRCRFLRHASQSRVFRVLSSLFRSCPLLEQRAVTREVSLSSLAVAG